MKMLLADVPVTLGFDVRLQQLIVASFSRRVVALLLLLLLLLLLMMMLTLVRVVWRTRCFHCMLLALFSRQRPLVCTLQFVSPRCIAKRIQKGKICNSLKMCRSLPSFLHGILEQTVTHTSSNHLIATRLELNQRPLGHKFVGPHAVTSQNACQY